MPYELMQVSVYILYVLETYVLRVRIWFCYFPIFCSRLMLLRQMMAWTFMILVIALNIHNFCWFFCVHFHMHLGVFKVELCRYYFHVSCALTCEFILCEFVRTEPLISYLFLPEMELVPIIEWMLFFLVFGRSKRKKVLILVWIMLADCVVFWSAWYPLFGF